MRHKILITGVAGFIGSHLAEKLLNASNIVIGIDNLNDYYNPLWKKENIKNLRKNKNFTFYKMDILNSTSLSALTQKFKPDVVVHLAARAGVRPSIADPALYHEVNVKGTLNVLEAVRSIGAKKIIFASSSSVYGNNKKIPFSEHHKTDRPVSPYAATKMAGEMLVHTYSHLYNISGICLRFFTVYGPKGRPDMAPYIFTESILKGIPINKFGDGNTSRDYTYVDDIVNGIISSIEYETKFDIFNLGGNNPITLNDYIKTLESVTNKRAIIKHLPMQPGDVEKTYANIDKAKKLLKYAPSTKLTDGLRQFIDWYKANRT